MEEFDFTTPINSTLVFEDSDDDKTPGSPDYDLRTEKKKGNDNNSIITVNPTINILNNKEKQAKNNEYTTELKSITEHLKSSASGIETIEKSNNTGSNWGVVNNSRSRSERFQIKQTPQISEINVKSALSQICGLQIKQIDSQIQPQHENKRKRKLSDNEHPGKRINLESADLIFNNKRNLPIYTELMKILKKEPHKSLSSNDERSIQVCNQAQNIYETISPQPLLKPLEINNQRTNDIQVLTNINTSTILTQASTSIPHHNSTNEKTEITRLRKSLKTVSEYMIYIINSYQSFMKIQKACNEPSLIKHAKDNFHRTKNHFFELSYTTVLNDIIPKEKDVTFIKNFLNYTIKLAQIKSYPFTYAHMEPLYLEIITWVKKKRDYKQNKDRKTTSTLLPTDRQNNNIHQEKPPIPNDATRMTTPPYMSPNLQQSQNLTMSQQIMFTGARQNTTSLNVSRTPPPPYMNHCHLIQKQTALQRTHDANPESQRVLTNCHGTPSHAYSNYSLAQIQKNNMQLQQKNTGPGIQNTMKSFDLSGITPPFTNISGQVQSMCTKKNTKSDTSGSLPLVYQNSPYSIHTLGHTLMPPTMPKLQTTGPETNKSHTTLSRVPVNNVNMGSIVSNQQIVNEQRSPPQNAQQLINDKVFNSEKNLDVFGYYDGIRPLQSQSKNLQSPPTYNDVQNVQWHKQMTQSCPNQAPSIFDQKLTKSNCPQNHRLDSSQNNLLFREDIAVPVEFSRSSISTDSGFISPLNFNSSSDQLGIVQEKDISKPIQNKSLPYIECKEGSPYNDQCKEGFCAVCKKTTTQRCLGCFKYFYCSFDCQVLDWKRHQTLCK